MHRFSSLITQWYRENHRDLPWRNTKNPYEIWVSEVIMQQTQVVQGEKYYYKIIERFPTVKDLAEASEQEVLRLWQRLGYYSRARNLHQAAKDIVNNYNGVFPSDYASIIKLKGVGEYTAAAISSFAFDLPYAVLDGNAFRVLSRFFGEDTPIDTSKGKKIFKEYADLVLDKKNPAIHNQAIMELGALVCTPRNPDCVNCPLNEVCVAFKENNFLNLPVKSKKIKVKKKYFYYFIFPSKEIQLVQRLGEGIWKNMFEFPSVESDKRLTLKELRVEVEDKFNVALNRKIFTEKHILTHQHIMAEFWEINQSIVSDEIIETDLKGLEKFPIPRLIERFMEENKLS